MSLNAVTNTKNITKEEKTQMNKNKGITLVALVITIIIMLILVAIVLRFTLFNGGIANKTQTAVDMHDNRQSIENGILADHKNELDDAYGKEPPPPAPPSIRSNNSRWKWRNRPFNDCRVWSNRNSMGR